MLELFHALPLSLLELSRIQQCRHGAQVATRKQRQRDQKSRAVYRLKSHLSEMCLYRVTLYAQISASL